MTPFATEPQIAFLKAFAVVTQVLPFSESSEPLPPRLMFATLMPLLAAFAVTQSIPQATEDQLPEPALLSTRTGYTVAPGATPTTPLPSSFAATVPATWVPCPLPSS